MSVVGVIIHETFSFLLFALLGLGMPLVDCETLDRLPEPPCSIYSWGGNHPLVSINLIAIKLDMIHTKNKDSEMILGLLS